MSTCLICAQHHAMAGRYCIRCGVPLPVELAGSETRPPTSLLLHLRSLKEGAVEGHLVGPVLAWKLDQVRDHSEGILAQTSQGYEELDGVSGPNLARERVLQHMLEYLDAVEKMRDSVVEGLARAEVVDARLQEALEAEAGESGRVVTLFVSQRQSTFSGIQEAVDLSPAGYDIWVSDAETRQESIHNVGRRPTPA